MKKKIGLFGAISIAVGTMIGASIFSIFGLGARISGEYLPFAFLISGIYAMAVAYSYAIMGSRIISNAGPIAFILKGLRSNLYTGAISILFWMSYVISIALFAKGVSGYLLPLFGIEIDPFSEGLTQTLIILFFTALNFLDSKSIGVAESFLVLVKLGILGIFIASGFIAGKSIDIDYQFDAVNIKNMLYGSVIFFLTYMGFGLITNASENIKNPQKNVPRAIYLSIFIVMIIYILISLTALKNLPVSEIIQLKDNALAKAAAPVLGSLGFILLSLGAVVSISSALNAIIYGGANVSYSLAKHGQLPKVFERKTWFNSSEGLFITSGLGLLLALLFDIGEVASITSTIITLIYISVLLSHLKLIKEIGGKKTIVQLNLVILVLVLSGLLIYEFLHQRPAFFGSLVLIAASLLIEFMYTKITERKFSLRKYRIRDKVPFI